MKVLLIIVNSTEISALKARLEACANVTEVVYTMAANEGQKLMEEDSGGEIGCVVFGLPLFTSRGAELDLAANPRPLIQAVVGAPTRVPYCVFITPGKGVSEVGWGGTHSGSDVEKLGQAVERIRPA